MSQQAMFDGLVYDEYDNLLATAVVGGEAQYVFDDDGFRRHIDANGIDRQVLAFFLNQLQENKELAVEQALRMLGFRVVVNVHGEVVRLEQPSAPEDGGDE